MKKSIKIFVILIISLILLTILDLVSVFTINRPLFAIKKDNVYKGVLYDVYDCAEYTFPQIKIKGEKFSCVNYEFKEIVNIIDKTTILSDHICAEALEQFFEDENYKYYYSCIKSKYIVVVYSDNTEETVESALKKGIICINDLDNYKINYHKYPKN